MNKNQTNAAGVFAKNPEVNELLFTSDGQCFYKRGPAMVHQKEIGGAEDGIEVVKREDTVGDADDKAAKKAEADAAKEKEKATKDLEKLKAKKTELEGKLAAEKNEGKKVKLGLSIGDVDKQISELEEKLK